MTRRSASVVFALASAALGIGCAPSGSARKPGFGEWALPNATLIADPILCPGTRRDGNGTPILYDVNVVGHADMGEAARATVREYLTRGFAKPSLELVDECDEMSSSRALDIDEWARPLPPKRYKQAMEAAKADALLVTLITTEEVCRSAGEGQQGVRCAESSMLLGAYLFTAQGDVVWKSWTRHPLGDGFPGPSLEEPRRLFLSYPTNTKY